MNIDLRAMESQAQELRAKMRDVLTRKLGKPRKVDKTLDDLLRQMARRHKFSATLGAIPQILVQLRTWRVFVNYYYFCRLQATLKALDIKSCRKGIIFNR